MKNIGTKSFTMVETLVSIAIFSLISLAVVNIFVSAITSQNRILQNQTLMEQSSYALEHMSRIIRMAKRPTTADCTGAIDLNYKQGVGEASLTFLAYDSINAIYRCRKFYLDTNTNTIKESMSNDETTAWATTNDITSTKVKISNITFGIVETADIQPRVTIGIRMQNSFPLNSPILSIQTTISQRELNIH